MELLEEAPWGLLQNAALAAAHDNLPVVLEYLATAQGELYDGGGGRQDRAAPSGVWVSAKGLGGGAGADAPCDNMEVAEKLKAGLSSEQEDPWAVVTFMAEHWRHLLDAARFPTWSRLAGAVTQAGATPLVGACGVSPDRAQGQLCANVLHRAVVELSWSQLGEQAWPACGDLLGWE